MKDEISSSLKASDIFGLIFSACATFGVENLSNLCKLVVCVVARPSGVLNRHRERESIHMHQGIRRMF